MNYFDQIEILFSKIDGKKHHNIKCEQFSKSFQKTTTAIEMKCDFNWLTQKNYIE